MKKFISFIITIGGDTGWRFTNGPEWCSAEARLLFDESIWTPEMIKKKMDELDKVISVKSRGGFTFSEKCSAGYSILVPFINNTEGVYSNPDFINSDGYANNFFNASTKGLKKEKVLTKVANSRITPWSLNGNSRNY